jgi:hypothetical protein
MHNELQPSGVGLLVNAVMLCVSSYVDMKETICYVRMCKSGSVAVMTLRCARAGRNVDRGGQNAHFDRAE